MSQSLAPYDAHTLKNAIRVIRGQRVMLDADLARVYGVTVKRLNEQVRRNPERFPKDFAFILSPKEVAQLRSQNIAVKGKGAPEESRASSAVSQFIEEEADTRNWSQNATSWNKHRGAAYRALAFTEHGAIMAANVLRSPQAIRMSVFVVRAFVKMREQLIARSEMEKRLLQIENILLSHDDAIRDLYEKLRPLLLPPPDPERKPIGFGVRERRGRYQTKSAQSSR